jgi:hypothetical protein
MTLKLTDRIFVIDSMPGTPTYACTQRPKATEPFQVSTTWRVSTGLTRHVTLYHRAASSRSPPPPSRNKHLCLKSNWPREKFHTVDFNYATYWTILRETSPVVQLLKNLPTLYGTWRFVTVFTRALHCSLSWARLLHSIPPPLYFSKIRFHFSVPPMSRSS